MALPLDQVKVVDADSGAVVATGEGVQTWIETGLGDLRQVKVELPAERPEGVFPLPLVVGAVGVSAVFLDLVGGESSRAAAQRLLGAGLLSAVPTAATGFAEWHDTTNPERRVGAAHAAVNSVALGLLGTSYGAPNPP